jgi:hypothetical protein
MGPRTSGVGAVRAIEASLEEVPLPTWSALFRWETPTLGAGLSYPAGITTIYTVSVIMLPTITLEHLTCHWAELLFQELAGYWGEATTLGILWLLRA